MKNTGKWRFAVDRGGTFTDVIGVDPSGEFHTRKLLSRSSAYEDASIEGIRRMLGLLPGDRLPEDLIAGIRFGTTVATNALLERKGGKVALLVTEGLSGLLEIGYQDRPDLFSLCIEKPLPLYTHVIEVSGRVDSQGKIVRDFDSGSLTDRLNALRKEGIDTAAVVLMHSWKNPEHELRCREFLESLGFENIFLSHKTVNLIKIISRGQSTMVDAYLGTVLAEYLSGIEKETGRIQTEFMQSSGVLSSPDNFKGKNAILSGPAGGVLAVAKIAREKGITGAIGFDMGGTSTDVSRFDGEFQMKYEQTAAGIPLQTEMLDIVTVAAGGGSILNFDGQKMTAGPESAGAQPGPACYGFRGPLTVTDANLITGRLLSDYFPRTFGVNRDSSVDINIVKSKFRLLADDINRAMGTDMTVYEAAAGFLRIANEKMAMAIKEISVSRGFDIRDYALVCFGGAGGQHACSIASLLDIERIIIHPLSSVMSAYGIGLSRPARKAARTWLRPFNSESNKELSVIFKEMENELTGGREMQDSKIVIKRSVGIRQRGSDTYLTLEYGQFSKTVSAFKERHHRLFGFSPAEEELEVVNLRLELQEESEFLPAYKERVSTAGDAAVPDSFQKIYYSKGHVEAPVYVRDNLLPFKAVKGPAFIMDRNFTLVVDPGYAAEADEAGIIVIKRDAEKEEHAADSRSGADPVLLEVFNNIFANIAAEMGITLQNTAHSVNIKERLDFSCAVFDSSGDLVANAPHIPVHLGSMADTVKAVLEDKRDDMRPGDMYLTNNPYCGGSHLPDMTVICPVFSDSGKLNFFTAARGHHADVGGSTPGSMPPTASHIDEEGVLLDSFLIVRNNEFREDELKEILSDHTYPVRNITERIYDFKAQIAACHKGTQELQSIITKYGQQRVTDYMGYIQDNAEYAVKKALLKFIGPNNTYESVFEDRLDDGTPIRAAVTIEGGNDPLQTVRVVIDFTGTGRQHMKDNLNAPLSVARSCVLYVLRALINEDIPLNSGCLKPVELIIPAGSIMSPEYPAPVASGNVETSQRVVDVLLGAFGAAAASQGTMNNLLFEVEGETPYYETIAGGAGAVDGCAGASGVQVHMTNTRMTDPEVLEVRHPGVRLEQFSLRKGSGGSGRFCGGDGVIREIKFLKPATVSIISERRLREPYGAKGGDAGKRGVNIHKKSDGEMRELKHREVLKVDKNESVIINTPGGGGYGKA